MIQDWFKGLLIDGIISNLTGMFDTLNTKVGEIAGEVGMTPAAWNSSIFNMIRNLSETVIVPIAGIILTFVMCYELIQLIIEKNNLHDFDTWIFFKWIFKTFCAVLIVTNTWNIVMAVFDVAQNVVSQSAGVIISDAGIDISGVVGDLETQLADWSVGALLGLWFQSVFVGLCTQILSICIFLVIYGRMIEVYLVTSIGPIPFATMVNREWGSTGQNYLRSLLALGFQAFLIMICVGIYAVLVEGRRRSALSGAGPSSALSVPFPQRSHRTSPGYSVFGLPSWYLASFRIRVWDVPNKHFSGLGGGFPKAKNRKWVLTCCACSMLLPL